MKESSPSGTQSERTGTVAKVVFSIVIIALAIYLIYVFNMVGKTGVIVGAGGVLGFEVTGYLLQQLVKSVREAKEYRKELGL